MKQQNKMLFFVTGLVGATLIAYEPIRHNGFVNFDDEYYITHNPHVQRGVTWDSIRWSFMSTACSNWHPATWWSHMLDCQWWGLNSKGHHAMSVLLHLANSVLLFILLARITGMASAGFIVAAIFALHPVHVESVAWISERKDVLSTFFFLLTLLAYHTYAVQPGWKRYAGTVLLFSLGLMAKPMLVTLPVVLLLMDYWPLRRWPCGDNQNKTTSAKQCTSQKKSLVRVRSLVFEKIPFFILAGISCVITYRVQQQGGAMDMGTTYPWGIRLANAVITYRDYIIKMLYPCRLAVLYPHPGEAVLKNAWIFALGLGVLVTAAVWYFRKKAPYLLVGWLWYVVTLVPVIGLVQVGFQGMADRYTYIPSIGFFLIVVWGVWPLAVRGKSSRILSASLTAIALMTLVLLTRMQVGYWRNSMTLFGRAVEVTRDNYISHNNYGRALVEAGRYDQAVEHLKQALQIKSDYLEAVNNLGMVSKLQGKYSQAVEYYDRAITMNPDRYEAINNLAWLYATCREYQYRDPQKALSLARKAQKITGRQNPDVLDTLAAAYAAVGDFPNAVRWAQQAYDTAMVEKNTQLTQDIRRRMILYQHQKPFVE